MRSQLLSLTFKVFPNLAPHLLLQKCFQVLISDRNPLSSARPCSQLHLPPHRSQDVSGSHCSLHIHAPPSTRYTVLPGACLILFFLENSSRSSLPLHEDSLIPPVPKDLCPLSVAGIFVCTSHLGGLPQMMAWCHLLRGRS